MIDGKALKSLEYGKVLAEVSSYCSGEAAVTAMRAFTPADSYVDANMLINLTCEADKILYEHCISPDFGYEPISNCIESAIKGSVLSIAQIKSVGLALRTARLVRKAIDYVNDSEIQYIPRICSELVVDSDLESKITDSISGDNELSDNASSELRRIRHALKGANDAVRSKLNSYLGGEQSKYLQDNIITMRSGRYVLPVKAECRSAIQGLLHDRSASGATIYIEPYAVVELNNEVKALTAQENAEIERILLYFTSEIASKALVIEQACDIVTRLDCIFARAKYARATRAVKPVINDRGFINIIKGRHPLLDKDKVVPVSLELGGEYSVMIISGPNTGGKTVTLKMCGLFTLMACSGLYVPCEEGSELSYFDAVYCDIGDAQSIERNLSTFSSHMLNISHILTCADNKSLVLLDEVGAGTDPQEGGALAVACVEYLFNKGCRCIATSHYDELKVYSAQTQGICNASMDFEPSTYHPTYRLITGIAGASNALETAANLGLPDTVIRRAYGMISPDKIKINALVKSAEKALKEAEADRKKAQEELNKADIALRQASAEESKAAELREKLQEKMRKGYKELLADYTEKAEEMLAQLKEKVELGNEKALFEARRIKNELSQSTPQQTNRQVRVKRESGKINVGDEVFVKSISKPATVISYNQKKREYTVKAGVISAKVSEGDVYKIKSTGGSYLSQIKPRGDYALYKDVGAEIDLRGQTYDEAAANLIDYIDDAIRSGHSEVRIIHGKGSGALRNSVREVLRAHKSVEDFREGKYGEGDGGVTVVKLK